MNVISEGNYMESCRSKGVPIPPDWKQSSSEWESHGNLKTILLTPNNLDQTPVDHISFASVWSYASSDVRGACIALGRNGGSFQIICQSATTGHACFGETIHVRQVQAGPRRQPKYSSPYSATPFRDLHRAPCPAPNAIAGTMHSCMSLTIPHGLQY